MNQSLEEFITDSELQLEKKKDALEDSKNKSIEFLKKYVVTNIEIKNLIIQDRVKKKESLREKIIRKNYSIIYKDAETFINNLTDIIGIRIVCLLEKEEKLLFEELDKIFTEDDDEYSIIPNSKLKESYLRINKRKQPMLQKNGYEIYKLDCQWISQDIKVNVELQIKSLVHMFWGEVEHMLFYKNYSYTVGAEFYRNYMNSTKQLLNTVDNQLDTMKNQLFFQTSKEQIEESRQMVTKLVYNAYQPFIINMYKCNLDLREVYDLAVHIKFQRTFENEEALSKTNEIINILHSTTGQMTDSTFQFEVYEANKSSFSKEIQEFSIILNSFAHGNDVFWKTFFATQKLLLKENNFTKVLDQTSEKLLSFFDGLREEFDEGLNEVTTMLMETIRLGIIEAFKSYKKIDFFSPSIYQMKIFDRISTFIQENKEEFYALDKNSDFQKLKEKLNRSVKFLIIININSIINKKITLEELNELNSWLNDADNLWLPTANRELLQTFINQKMHINQEQFKLLFKELEE